MNSFKAKSNKYSRVKGKAIGGIVLTPAGKGQFRMYVAWENEKAAIEGRFSISESEMLIDKKNIEEAVNNVADYGFDVTHKAEIRELFGNLF